MSKGSVDYPFDRLEQILHLFEFFAGHGVVNPVDVEVLRLLLLLLHLTELLEVLLAA
jgi:hypothetical protein